MAKKILIAEDEKAIAKILAVKLKKSGYDVDIAYDGEEALEKFERKSYDLLLLDLIMPRLDGFGVLESLKKKSISVPVIVTSNLGQENDRKEALKLGAKEYLVKADTPMSEIVTRVSKILGQ